LKRVQALRVLASLSAVLAYLQATLGGVVRVSGSGEGCQGWPLCSGRAFPAVDTHALIEYAHRTNGTLLGLAVLGTAVLAWVAFRHQRRLAWLATAALVLVAFEGAVGGTVVLADLQGLLVMFHFGVAQVILALLVVLALSIGVERAGVGDVGFRRLSAVVAIATYVLLMSGASVVASDAEDSCLAWPLCGNGFQLDASGLNAFNSVHRALVLLVGVLVVYVAAVAWRRWREQKGVRLAAALTAMALMLQVAAGAGVALSGDSGFFAGLHVGLATATWAGMVAMTALLWPGPELRTARSNLALRSQPT
jgi:heme A synthase